MVPFFTNTGIRKTGPTKTYQAGLRDFKNHEPSERQEVLHLYRPLVFYLSVAVRPPSLAKWFCMSANDREHMTRCMLLFTMFRLLGQAANRIQNAVPGNDHFGRYTVTTTTVQWVS